jgi:hypothetical protein
MERVRGVRRRREGALVPGLVYVYAGSIWLVLLTASVLPPGGTSAGYVERKSSLSLILCMSMYVHLKHPICLTIITRQ